MLGRIDPVLVNELNSAGCHCKTFDELDSTELIKEIEPYHGLVVRTYIVDQKIIDAGKNLEFIARAGSGLEKIDVAYAKENQIDVLNSPEGNADAVAEQAIAMLLNMLHKITLAHNQMHDWQFNRASNTGYELGNKTVGIIGFGNTGSRFASKLSGFGCRMLAYDKYKTGFENELVKEATLEEIFEKAEVLSLHIPYNTETHHLVNVDFINRFTNSIYLINTSRGPIVKSADIIKFLNDDKLSGLALDVFENEKFNTYNENEKSIMQQIMDSKKCLITPHIAGWSFESDYKIAAILAKKIKDFLQMSK